MYVRAIVLFDGDCSFCNRSVQFIIKRDPNKTFQFASLQSDIGRQLQDSYSIPKTIDSMILIENNKYYVKSTAALRICKNLKGFWKMFYMFIIVPVPLRHMVYDLIAKYRHMLNRQTVCTIPSKEDLERFLS